ncbi:MAG: hypothetical protein PUG14_01605 [Acholeplasmatales bacterium]|jgi:hypothetical protein|nr:hypothetical protein [Acholeplasmatales bacterium]MDD7394749.1 hypothetical protein [Acholeplasmatales bacterium]
MNSLQKLVCFLTETTEMEKKAWQTGYIVLVIFALIPWIVLTIYFITLKYHVKYYVNNELVNVAKYKKNQAIEEYSYNNNNVWYKDEECSEQFTDVKMPPKNIKLYQNTVSEDTNSEEIQK